MARRIDHEAPPQMSAIERVGAVLLKDDTPKNAPVAAAVPAAPETVTVPREEWQRVKAMAERAYTHIFGSLRV